MRTLILVAALAAATPALAQDLSLDSTLGTTLEQARASLAAMGYDVRKAEMENGKIELYFVKGNSKGEVYVSTQTGQVTKIEMK